MQETIKQTWTAFTISAIVASLLSFIPVQKMQSKYMSEFYRLKSEPQKRIEATFRYIEALEDGTPHPEISSKNIPNNTKQDVQKPYQKPLYVRDKHNPKILHRYER